MTAFKTSKQLNEFEIDMHLMDLISFPITQ